VLKSPQAGRALGAIRIDLASSAVRPSWSRWAIATVVALVGSLLADAVLVVIGETAFPSTQGYVHFAPRRARDARPAPA
jgi:hypothetical protein